MEVDLSASDEDDDEAFYSGSAAAAAAGVADGNKSPTQSIRYGKIDNYLVQTYLIYISL